MLAAGDGLRLPSSTTRVAATIPPRRSRCSTASSDIYMPDMKYGDSRLARRYSKVPDYVEVNRAAVKEMHRQSRHVGEFSRLDAPRHPLDGSAPAGAPPRPSAAWRSALGQARR